MTTTRTTITAAPLPHDDSSWMPFSAFGPIEQQIGQELTATIESWLNGLPTRSVHRPRGRGRKGNDPT
jgi:hypothetical protein